MIPILGYVLLYGAVTYLANLLVLNEPFFLREWNDVFGPDRMDLILEQRRKWMLVGYALIPPGVVIKILFPAVCLAVGCAVADWDCSFRSLVYSAVRAELALAFGAVVHLGCILFLVDITSMMEYASFYPASALHFVDLDVDRGWMAYPLKTANVFELVYVILLGSALSRASGRRRSSCILLTAASYGAGLALLVSVVTFGVLYVT